MLFEHHENVWLFKPPWIHIDCTRLVNKFKFHCYYCMDVANIRVGSHGLIGLCSRYLLGYSEKIAWQSTTLSGPALKTYVLRK